MPDPAVQKPREVTLGRRLAGTRVLLLIDELHIRVLNRATGELFRDLTPDPPPAVQPRGAPSGPPDNAP